jgi:AcrR family transcriptional regulator
MSQAPTRTRNRRGEGARLRQEIVTAAGELLEETGDESAITLRAVARRVGITPPSIYGHFSDRAGIVHAVLVDAFAAMAAGLHAATDGVADPVERLHAGCAAYLQLAAQQPARYRMLFQRRPTADPDTLSHAETVDTIVGAEAFGWLLDAIGQCVETNRSATPSPLDSAVQIWVALHGFATLRASANDFPWPDTDTMIGALIGRLAYIDELTATSPTAAP